MAGSREGYCGSNNRQWEVIATELELPMQLCSLLRVCDPDYEGSLDHNRGLAHHSFENEDDDFHQSTRSPSRAL